LREAQRQEFSALWNNLDTLQELRDRFIAAAKAQAENETSGMGGTQYETNKMFAGRIKEIHKDFLEEKMRHGSVGVGSPSAPLLKVGVPDVDIYFDESKIYKTFDKHKEVGLSEMQNIVDVLENPIVITESYDNTVLCFGELFDKHGSQIMVAVRINCDPINPEASIEGINKVRSVGSRKKSFDKLLQEDNIQYLNPDKKKTISWFRDLGSSTPYGGTKFGLIRSITKESEKSNTGQKKIRERDEEYMRAVESGDMETAQCMVDEAAEKAVENDAYFSWHI
jgi:hypothetical protein